ncbi:hypothetical protein E1B28_000680 [Marasmius oreades]|uniref:Uncharacterized protein n=1 Tax=Marasmius oreades TaxID=181124 RepID=A0A9P8AEL3_9AGAR|nr:uncharacterized protein E1B28_000680 [Marasmius oreades]KAG7098772.1 hypothetical protein E1B28_000680 [Marasmius oreades]
MTKEYIDRAVQTEPPRHLSRSDNPRSLNIQPSGDAYNRPSHPKKPLQLGQISKPSEATLPTRRVVSLPESSPPHRFKPTNERYRIASMSEAHSTKTIKICTSADSSLSSECLESSVSLDSSQLSSDLYSNRPQRSSSLANVAFSHTPSPPSSPESSIMIIGNNVQVSNHFLSSRARIDNDDEQGWTTWTDSPPRPIPALHGPLSLPYARCPSGAEGILVEGEDLSHMIWGLRQDEINPSGPREPQETKAVTRVSPDAPVTRQATQPHPYLTTPSSLASSSPAFKLWGNDAYRPSPPLLTPRDTDSWWYECDDSDDSPIIIPPTPQQLKNFLELQCIFELTHPEIATGDAGLGLFWPKPGQIAIDTTLPRQLQASAPVFIPNPKINRQVPEIIPISNIGATGRGRSISAINIATEYALQQANPLITTPNTASTQWTSRFPDVSPVLSDDRLHTTSCDGFEEEQRVLNLDQLNAGGKLLVQDQATERDAASKDPSSNVRLIPTDDLPLRTLCPSVASHSKTSAGTGNAPSSNLIVPKSQSPELIRSSAPQPRSVPFARLMQRRLSAVREEELGIRIQVSSNAPIPRPLRNRYPGFHNGAQAPNKPYFAQASQNHLDIPNKAYASPSSPVPEDAGRILCSRVLTNSAVASSLDVGSKQPVESGSCTPSPVPDPVSKENLATKSGDCASKGPIKKRGRNRAKKQESSVFKNPKD